MADTTETAEPVKKSHKKLAKKLDENVKRKARRKLAQELFDDFYEDRRRVYWFNFVRGLFFGFGTALGGTLLIGVLLWLLSQLGSAVLFLSDFIREIINAVQAG